MSVRREFALRAICATAFLLCAAMLAGCGSGSNVNTTTATADEAGQMLDTWTNKWVKLNSVIGEARAEKEAGTDTPSTDRRVYRGLAPFKRAGSQARILLRHNDDDWKVSVVSAGDALAYWATDFYKLKEPQQPSQLKKQASRLADEATDAVAKLENAYKALDRDLPASVTSQ